ncbi:mycofactocin biosynthesis peptidyl-dipeptidase MftE [Saccharopolyspora karakumensis]|uniref:Mycofactocin biosynthesis peptidyl-dipeptidase MftE n=1 Tax=Saccharopolyspora karakumensis TaxID=2530386 RepID=A0A4R5BAU0_9PSEU|nr:mycofactocin biosynthesis peptidyl-dipeptidase MftE [Saccharopolyspora karakumensis]TDD80854.1 mycofactocin biosynthesis peptidyl-dipeptidase MftE [Saccharopolyspora karakumensis]
MNLGETTWPELREPRLLAVPVGATEQHGPHLPCTVDTDIAVALCDGLAEQRPVVVAPAVAYGSSGEHAVFPGTLSIGRTVTELLLTELGRSADAFAGVVLVSCHGGNAAAVRNAVRTLRSEGRRVLAWSPTGPADDSHAGRTETSAMLALRPHTVHLERAEAGNTEPLPELIDRLRDGGTAAVSDNGVLGDPRGASGSDGRRILRAWTESLVAAVDTWASSTER